MALQHVLPTSKNSDEDYLGYVLATEDEINSFLGAFAMGPSDTGAIIQKEDLGLDLRAELSFKGFIQPLKVDFPSSSEMSAAARRIFDAVYNHEENIVLDPDSHIISWFDTEYRLFRKMELSRYGDLIKSGFQTVEQFIETANTVLNRRKSRAGKSLEHHLAAIFDGNNLIYQSQPKTEGNKRPDFLFPGEAAYRDMNYPPGKLVFLGAKTTCKTRWREVVGEAGRIERKHLFTLQQGMSAQQLDEMEAERVTLVVPAPYIAAYPQRNRKSIWSLRRFIAYVKEKATV